jgi:hypothetical protein
VHGDVTASLPRPYGASTALVLCFHGVLLILLRSHRDYTELPRPSLRSYGAPTVSISVCRALKQRCQCVVSKPHTNGIKAASSLSLSFCFPDLIMGVVRQQAEALEVDGLLAREVRLGD